MSATVVKCWNSAFFFIGNSGKNNKEKQQQLKFGQISFKDYVNNVVYAANGNVSFTTFKNRLIGAYAFDKSSPNYGRGCGDPWIPSTRSKEF